MDIEEITAGPFEVRIEGHIGMERITIYSFDSSEVVSRGEGYEARSYRDRHNVFEGMRKPDMASEGTLGELLIEALNQALRHDHSALDYVDFVAFCPDEDDLRSCLLHEFFGDNTEERSVIDRNIERIITEVRAETASHAIRRAARQAEMLRDA